MKISPKKVLISLVVITGLLTFSVMLFVNYAPQFGSASTGQSLDRIQSSPHYQEGQFVNGIETSMDMGVGAMAKTLQEFVTVKNVRPNRPLPTRFGHAAFMSSVEDDQVRVTWYGHSAILLEMEGKRLLLDPMLGPAASPVSFFAKRFPYQTPINLDPFTDIDAIIISHDHYDHLDYWSIQQLKDKTQRFFVPLGISAHLQRWGVSAAKITELDWWQSANLDGLTLTATPARHFSGRGLTDRNKTLWASWALQGEHANVYFSGDSGYGPHFQEIGERLGPFDFTMIECGQYNEKWEAIHMLPEQSLQAHQDVQGKVMMPIHWGAFNLAVHSWKEPVERLLQKVNGDVVVATPSIGRSFVLNQTIPNGKWWE